MGTMRACSRCGRPLPKRHRKYCLSCSALASTIWKRAQRRRWRGTPYSLDPWLKKAGGDESEARRLRSEYMRSYRLRVQLSDRPAISPLSRADGHLESGVDELRWVTL
jgi:hypothetical protein